MPTDTFIQYLAQQAGGHGWVVAGLLAAAAVAIAITICLYQVWQEVRRDEAQLQQDKLARAMQEARRRDAIHSDVR